MILRLTACLAIFATAAGCSEVSTREACLRNSLRLGLEQIDARCELTPTSRALLARRHLLGVDPEFAALQLEAGLRAGPAVEPDGPLALAELWYQVGLAHQHPEPMTGLLAYRYSATAAAIAAATPDATCPGRAVEVHNKAVAQLLRLSQSDGSDCPPPWNAALAGVGVATTAAHPFVDPARFVDVDVAADIQVTGMRTRFEGAGIGVPVVALRPNDRSKPREPSEAFFPPRLRVGATVVAVPQGSLPDGTWRTAGLSLVFHDPFQTKTVDVGGRPSPMAYDTTTPLAVQASQKLLSAATFAGLFVSDFQRNIEPGLYLLKPYEPGKIPIVMIHGLNSNPGTFVQVLNELENDPAIAARYQFLLFAYPTGRAIPISALRLRRALYDAESKFGDDPAFREMVLVGHSMGGNVTRFMVTDTGTTLWDAVFKVPYDRFQATPETKAYLKEGLIFRPVPFVKNTVFIAAPHRGSPLADEPIGRIVSRFIRPSPEQTRLIDEIKAFNGPDVIEANILRNRSINSIGNLSPRSPVLLAIDRLPLAPGVEHHTIQYHFLGRFPGDLVVPHSSSSIAGVVSERDLPGTHFSVQSRDTVAELRSILLD